MPEGEYTQCLRVSVDMLGNALAPVLQLICYTANSPQTALLLYIQTGTACDCGILFVIVTV